MPNRNLSTYVETRHDEGPYWLIEADRSASGEPTVLFTIKYRSYDGPLKSRETTIVVENAAEFLAPINAWLAALK